MSDLDQVVESLRLLCASLLTRCDISNSILVSKAASMLEQSSRWIPVTERLPETRQFVPNGSISSSKVLFITSDKTIHLGYLINHSYVDEYAGETILHHWYDDHGDRIENVTKWCEPPKEEDGA